MTVQFKPLKDYIQIEPIVPNINVGSILVATDEHLRPTKGKVLAVGPGTYEKGVLKPVPVSIGDVIGFVKGSMEKIYIGKEVLYIVPAGQLVGVERA